MIKFLKKPVVFIPLIIVVIVALNSYSRLSHSKNQKYDFVMAKKGNLTQAVNANGRVKPAESVDLAFEKSGKVNLVKIKIGDKVTKNQLLVKLDSADLSAQLAQAEADLKSQEAKLDELKRGSRPEEIQNAEIKVANGQKAVSDAQTNLDNVKQKASVDLSNLYDDISDILHDAYTKADDALSKQIDELFSSDFTNNPQLTFTVSDMQAKIDSEAQRLLANNALTAIKTIVDNLPTSQTDLDIALNNAESQLTVIRNFLNRLYNATNAAVGLTQAAIDTYKSDVNTARTNINTAISNIDNQRQLIAAQKATNQSNITTAETALNTAQSSLAVAENDLALKKAGSTSEQIRIQEAQAEQAQASIQNYQAQIAETVLFSPIDGVVTRQEAKVGEIMAANTIVVSLISESQFEIESNVAEADIAKVKIGDSARVTLDAYSNDVVFEAEVVAIDPAETMIEGVATYKTTLHFTHEDGRIKTGMTADIDILTDQRENVIIVPIRTVITKDGDSIVQILKGKKPVETKVKTGLRGSDGNIEIIDGLTEGDKVVIPQQ